MSKKELGGWAQFVHHVNAALSQSEQEQLHTENILQAARDLIATILSLKKRCPHCRKPTAAQSIKVNKETGRVDEHLKCLACGYQDIMNIAKGEEKSW